MEREILFRGKHDPKYGVGWCYGVPYTDHDGDCIMATNISRRVVIKETVGQYTGLTDKNGVKIFEGDVVRTQYGRLCVVIWNQTDCHCGWDLYPVNDDHKPPSKWCMFNKDCLEVVANIHDNPELLKGEPNV